MSRKSDHIKICMGKNVEFEKGALWDDAILAHNAVPQLSLQKIDTSTSLLGKQLSAPLMVAAMTGGVKEAAKINKTIASVCQKLGLGFGVGSQRAAIENPKLAYTYQVRDVAPEILLLGNLGLVQFTNGLPPEAATEAVEMIGADALCIHLNAAQEAVQPEGDTNFERTEEKLTSLCNLKIKIVAKETGCGISRSTGMMLVDCGVSAIDVGGAGGTSWTAVESYRSSSPIGKTFWNWGIPTAASTAMCANLGVPIIATGGVRDGIHMAKAIALGASCCGVALPVLKLYPKGKDAIEQYLSRLIKELKIAMFLTGSESIEALQNQQVTIKDELATWINKSRNPAGPGQLF